MLERGNLSVIVAGLAALAGGCHKSTCTTIADPEGLWARAAVVKVAAYGSNAHCANGTVSVADTKPLASRTFRPSDAIALDLSAGHRAIVITLFEDESAASPLGTGCTEGDFAPASQSCVSLTLSAVVDTGILYCDGVPCGCQTDSDCAGLTIPDAPDGGAPPACCGGRCVNLAAARLRDCGSGVCVAADSCCTSADCTAAPGPAACFMAACSRVGGTCSYAMPSDNVVCATTCCRAVNGTCAADCTLSCATGFADCDGNPANGCELSIYDVNHCGSCFNVCGFPGGMAACPTGTCVLTGCNAGTVNCDGQASNGCECAGNGCCAGNTCQTNHMNGVGQTFDDCQPLDTYDVTQATEACTAFTGDASQCHPSATCGIGQLAVCSDGSSNACDCWIYSGTAMGKVRTGSVGFCNCSTKPNLASWN
jgi:hypothetical protein